MLAKNRRCPKAVLYRDSVLSKWLALIAFVLSLISTLAHSGGNLELVLGQAMILLLAGTMFFGFGWMQEGIVLWIFRGHDFARWFLHWSFMGMLALGALSVVLIYLLSLLDVQSESSPIPSPEFLAPIAAYGFGVTFSHRQTPIDESSGSA